MPETDARLVLRARGGDAAAFDVLVRRHLPAAHAVALGVTGQEADADDVCQDAFIAALERLEDCRKPERFRSWLLSIVRNRARNLLRSRRVRDPRPTRRGADPPPRYEVVDPRPRADRQVAVTQERERLLEALAQLPENQREVVLLHDLQGMIHRDVAELVGITEGSARVLLHRARRSLRALLETGAEEGS